MYTRAKTYIIGFIILLASFPPIGAEAQNYRIKFDKITQDLTQSTITSIFQDYQGFMWFGTMDGLNRFDGYSVNQYRHKSNSTSSLPDNVINYIFEDSQKRLWIGTRGGMVLYNRLKNTFIHYPNNIAKQSAENNIICINETNGGQLWVATANGLYTLETQTKHWKKVVIPNNEGKQLGYVSSISKTPNGDFWFANNNKIVRYSRSEQKFVQYPFPTHKIDQLQFTVILAENDKLWIGSNQGLLCVDPNTGKIIKHYRHKFGNSKSISGNHVTCLAKDTDGVLWVGTHKSGLNRFILATEDFIPYTHQTNDKHSLSTNAIRSLYIDQTNILWIGTSLGGVNKWSRLVEGMEVFRHNPYEPSSVSSNQIRTFFQDSLGNFWVGTVDAGLNYWHIADDKFYHYRHSPKDNRSLSHNHVRTILFDNGHRMWIGTDGGGINLMSKDKKTFRHFKYNPDTSHSLPCNRVWKLHQDHKGRIWVGTYGGGISWFYPKENRFLTFQNNSSPNSISNNFVTTIYEDSKQRIWIGTYGGGLNLWQPADSSFKRFLHNPNSANSIGSNRVYSILESRKGEIWVGTKGSLNKLNTDTGHFQRFTEDNGLPNDVILSMLEDGLGYLWISTNRGLCKFHPETGTIRIYDRRDGLQHNEFLVGAAYESREGELLFGGINGYNTFFPTSIRDNKNIPRVMITKFELFNKEFPLDTVITEKRRIELEWHQNFINLEFVALNYIHPEKNQYKYFLAGKDRDTIYNEFRRASYTDLEPGNYTFTVKASNNDGIWNDIGTQLEIVIHPAFWQTKTFKFLVVVAIAIGLFLFYYIRTRTLKLQKEKLEKTVELRTAEIRQQNKDLADKNHEIEMQAEELTTQRDVLQMLHDEITKQKKEITDSIHYAERIQAATLPTNKAISRSMQDHFILFRPRDIVSGDFYWTAQIDDKLIIMAADCTGHGVPGAFMSMLGISFLNKIVKEKRFSEPHEILNQLRKSVIEALNQHGADGESKDGMDAALLTIDTTTGKAKFSGANNPLYLVRDDSIQIYWGDKMPIAFYTNMQNFNTVEIDLQKNDSLYLFSDGYADQFGGPKGKKFKYQAFRGLLEKHNCKSMQEIGTILENEIVKWQNHLSPEGMPYDQVDDILVIGLRV